MNRHVEASQSVTNLLRSHLPQAEHPRVAISWSGDGTEGQTAQGLVRGALATAALSWGKAAFAGAQVSKDRNEADSEPGCLVTPRPQAARLRPYDSFIKTGRATAMREAVQSLAARMGSLVSASRAVGCFSLSCTISSPLCPPCRSQPCIRS